MDETLCAAPRTAGLFRFTIRDLLWTILAIALALAWWIDLIHARNRHAEVVAQARRLRLVLVDAKNRDVRMQTTFDFVNSQLYPGAKWDGGTAPLLNAPSPDWKVIDEPIEDGY